MAFSCGSHNDDVILLFSGLWLNPASIPSPTFVKQIIIVFSCFTEYLLYIGAILLAEKLKGSARKQYKLSIVVETLLPFPLGQCCLGKFVVQVIIASIVLYLGGGGRETLLTNSVSTF